MRKKIFLTLTALIIAAVGVNAATTQTGSLFSDLKDAIVTDVQNAVTKSATSAINQVKLANYKNQLAKKKQELADLEKSNTNFFVKFFKRYSLNRDIRQLEASIAELENEAKTTTTSETSK